ncbi:nucleotidyltransferase domain-containing protein [Thermococcus sp. MAR1]|uniref:nucleotidyltransferase domain-containing protein n=1 Tax=Thermococcus sp. MAR1 TaxID=1638263 RepID=UPI00143B6F5B|nr:nucleotidyltransferase domain-containing protein [Thermococcus sp. MAR1]NJE09766.1 nucleotidyltransferase domain-containing protein [Thermococcus sp. MAR1]
MPVIQRDELEKILREVKEKLEEILGDDLVEVILFGSYARGEAREDSDVDVLVVVRRKLTLKEHDKLTEVTDRYVLERGIVVSLIVYPLSRKMKYDPLIQNVQAEGIKV